MSAIEILDVEETMESKGTTALQQITASEVDMQVATAKQWPRSIKTFSQQALSMATLDEETAAACFFAVPRSGKVIEGPSVRLAEIVASCWGNLRCETRVIDTTETEIVAQGTAWDMERNVLIRTESRRKITNRAGKRYSEDMVINTGNAAASIALRNAIFKVVPQAYVNAIYHAAKETAKGNARTLVSRRAAAVGWFAEKGVKEEQLCELVGKASLDDITTDDLATLQGLRTAILEGTTTVADAFPSNDKAGVKTGKQGFGFTNKSTTVKNAAPEKPAAEVAQ